MINEQDYYVELLSISVIHAYFLKGQEEQTDVRVFKIMMFTILIR